MSETRQVADEPDGRGVVLLEPTRCGRCKKKRPLKTVGVARLCKCCLEQVRAEYDAYWNKLPRFMIGHSHRHEIARRLRIFNPYVGRYEHKRVSQLEPQVLG